MEARVSAEGQTHDLVCARRNAACGQHQVGLRGFVEGLAQLRRGVSRTQVGDDASAGLLDEAAQQDAVRIGNLAALESLTGLLQFRARRHNDDARSGQDRQGAVPDRGSGRQGRPIQDASRLQDRGTGREGLARDAHVLAQLRGDADLHRLGRLRDARRVVRVLDFHDSVGASRDGGARHDAPRLPLLKAILAGVARRNITGDGQCPRSLALQVLATHRKPVHRGIRERWQWDQRADVDGQAATQALLDGKRLVGENVAECQCLNQLAMLRSRQGGIVHDTSVEPGGMGEACGDVCFARDG